MSKQKDTQAGLPPPDDVLDSPTLNSKIKLLIAFMRAEKGDHPLLDFYADLGNQMARFAHDISSSGLILSEKWKSGELTIQLKEGRFDLHQVSLSSPFSGIIAIKRKGREFKEVCFSVPDKHDDALDHVMGQLISALPDTVCETLFEKTSEPMPQTWDEGLVKEWAIRQAEEQGLGKMMVMKRGDSVQQSFAPQRRAMA